jgi:hypothetical protein
VFSPGIWWSGVEPESLGLVCPGLADELVGCEPSEGLKPASEVVDADEVGEMDFELLVAVVVVALDSGFLDGAVHAYGSGEGRLVGGLRV